MKWLTDLKRYQALSRAEPADFAPEVLRLQAAPPHPLPRAVLGTALALFAAALAWAAFGKLDIVAVAHGKLTPHSYLKIIQPAEAGIVKEILVQEGERVKAGQVLIRMDTTLAAADQEALQLEYVRKTLALRRMDAELSGRLLTRAANEPEALFREVHAQYLANRQSLAASVAQEQATLEHSRQEMSVARETQSKLEQVIPHYRDQDEAFRKLVSSGFAGKLAATDKTRILIEKEQDLHTQAFIIAREEAAMDQSTKRIAQIRSDYLRNLRSEREEISERVEKLRQELAKQVHRGALLELKAPQDGLVKDLATHTVGAVAQPGSILMTLVPAADGLRAEVWLSNDDVGFVRSGQAVRVKLAAFQFQKYGMLDGKVEQVAADAAEQQENAARPGMVQQPLTYRTLVSLDAQRLVADGVVYPLAAGMQASAEIRLGERSVLEYLLSPVRKAFHEAGRER
ncbi:MAG: HlyD family type I secretion periplasmic adaptor subunit [Pseudomonadota bacterium]